MERDLRLLIKLFILLDLPIAAGGGIIFVGGRNGVSRNGGQQKWCQVSEMVAECRNGGRNGVRQKWCQEPFFALSRPVDGRQARVSPPD